MNEIRLKARAKINLTLDITGKQDNGYHTLSMIMQTLALYDGVYMKKIKKPIIRLKTNWSWLPSNEKNLAYRGAMLLRERFQIKDGVYIELHKKIPVAAGLAGGSTDCAAVMVGMNRMFQLGLSTKKLMELSLELGSDIPYCIFRGTALAEGIGEQLTRIQPPCPFSYVVLAKPNVNVSTAYVYQNYDAARVQEHPNTPKMLELIKEGRIEDIGANLCNVLESVTIPLHPQIEKIKNHMNTLGSIGTLMSGSGPTVFGLFLDKTEADLAAASIRREFHLRDVLVTSIWDKKRGEIHD